ncbi:DUF2125 domain-containing protein [Roseovarius sp.]|uniref:DUF2125 domain-containing protein n=1 Tax=Roseovarius sp. TaxID=1486281 RepID=UPI003D0F783E
MALRPILLAVALSAPQVALADLTVEAAWEVWTTQFEALGLKWQAETKRDGAALAVGPIFLTLRVPGTALDVNLQLPGPRFVPDGPEIDVRLPVSEAMPFSMSTAEDGAAGFTSSGAFAWRMEDVTVLMRETEAGIETRWRGQSFEIALTEFGLFGTPYPAAYRYLQSGFDITQKSDIRDGWLDFTRRGEAERVLVEYGYGDETTAEGLVGALDRHAVETVTELRLPPEGPVLQSLSEQAADGMAFRHTMSAERGIDSDKDWLNGALIATSQTDWSEIKGDFALDQEGLRIVSGAQQTAMQLTDETLGVNFDIEASRVLLDLVLPVLRDVAPQDFALRFELDGLAMSEESWAQFFMAEDFPRQAADVAVDLGGEVILVETLFDLDAMSAAFGGALPFFVETLDLRALGLRLPEAEVTGSGVFRFDHMDYETLDGFPATEGRAVFDVTGAQALLDRLVSAKVLTTEDAMSARMMLGMFTRPVEGQDETARSEVEITADGQVLVNGQRMR